VLESKALVYRLVLRLSAGLRSVLRLRIFLRVSAGLVYTAFLPGLLCLRRPGLSAFPRKRGLVVPPVLESVKFLFGDFCA